jgi:hypothetical protein
VARQTGVASNRSVRGSRFDHARPHGPIPPPRATYRFAELETLANAVMGRLQTWYRSGAKRDARSIQEALQDFNDAVRDFVDSDERP